MTNDGILTDQAVLSAIDRGEIEIDPFDKKQLNPTSYDLTLGDEVAVYDQWVYTDMETMEPLNGSNLKTRNGVLDVKEKPTVTKFKINKNGWVILPGIGYLMHTRERVHTKSFVPVLDGKSSLGRLFVQVHATAGYGDPGFNGQYTLEVTATHPIRIYADKRIAQIRFHTMVGAPLKLYDGNYKGEASMGAVPSAAWKMFR